MSLRACTLFAGLLSTGLLPGQDWPAFRGPTGDGVASSDAAPVSWSAEKNVRWKVPLPRPGNGSPIVVGDRVLVTSAEDEHGTRRSLYCFDRAKGRRLWVRTVDCPRMPTHDTNPYCGTTPASGGGRVVVWRGSAGLTCYDLDGEARWHRDLGRFRHRWGYGTSPIIHGDRVILHSGPGRRVFLAAFDLAKGETVWRHDEPVDGDGQDNAAKRYMGSWSTPIFAEVAGREQLVCAFATRMVGFDPATGKVLWSFSGIRNERGDLAYQSPTVVGDTLVYIAGFGGPGMGVRLDAACKGDITQSHQRWRHKVHDQCIGSGVAVGGLLYSPAASGQLHCIDPGTGETGWKQRAGRGQVWASVVRSGDRLYVTDRRGTTSVFRIDGERPRLLAENALGEPCNATPALAGAEVFVRTGKHLWCIAGEKESVRRPPSSGK